MLVKILVALGGLGFFALEFVLFSPKPQQGYIILQKGDTVACLIKKAENSSLYYKSASDSIFHRGGVENIKEYKYDNKNQSYKAVKMPDAKTPVYMKVVDTGKIELYVFYERRGKQTNTYLFAQKQNEGVVKLFGYKKEDDEASLAQLIAGNQQATDYLTEKSAYTVNKVTNCIRLYNNQIIDAN